MKHTLAIALAFFGTATALAAEPESPDRVDPPLDCPSPVLDAGTPEQAKWLRVQAGGDAVARELRETYADQRAGEIALEIYAPEAEGVDIEAIELRPKAAGAPLRVDITTA